MFQRLFLLITLLLSITPFLRADDENENYEPDALFLQESAPDPGSAITIISRDQIERSHADFVLDLLRSVPGVFTGQFGSAGGSASSSIRDSERNQMLLVIDGVRLDQSIAPGELAHLRTTNIERIEIQRGPQSALYGSSAMGGVIRIISRHDGPWVSGYAATGSDDVFSGGVRSGFGSERNFYAAAFDRFTTDGETNTGDYNNTTLALRGKVMITNWTSVGVEYRDIDASGWATPGDWNERIFSVPFQQQITKWGYVEAGYSYHSNETDTQVAHDKIFHIAGVAQPSANQKITVGYEYQKIELYNETTNNAGFADYKASILPKLDLDLSVRNDQRKEFDSVWSPRATASYGLNSYLRIQASAGSGFRSPRYDEERASGGLKSEHVTGFDFGGTVETQDWTARAIFFRDDYDRLIAYSSQSQSFENIDGKAVSGVELSGNWNLTSWIRVNGSFTGTSEPPPLLREIVPQRQGSVGADSTYKRFRLNFVWSLIGPRDAVDGYNRADLAASVEIRSRFEAFVRVTNLFDDTYTEIPSLISPNRAVYFGLRLN